MSYLNYIKITVDETCNFCLGDGRHPMSDSHEPCDHCEGIGFSTYTMSLSALKAIFDVEDRKNNKKEEEKEIA
jgi:DnaJ-class molecular chaperone